MPNEDYLALSIREFERLKSLADRAIDQLPDALFFEKPASGDNSVGAIVKHVGGNLLSRWTDFLVSDGEKPGRNRDTEFVILSEDSRDRLLAQWEDGWNTLLKALAPLGANDLTRTATIRGEPLTVLQAINRQLTHYAYHVGQIVYLAKHFCGANWKTLSIAVGQSDRFNRSPAKYIEPAPR